MRGKGAAVFTVLLLILASPLVFAQSYFPCAGSSYCDPVCPLEVFVGYASNLGATKTDETLPEFGDEFSLTHSTTHDVYLGLGLPVALTDRVAVRLSGGITIPGIYRADSYDDQFDPAELARQYHSETVWGTVDGMLGYQVIGDFFALAGFRWDNFQSKYTNPRIHPAFAGVLAPTDSGDLMMNTFVPLVGVMTNMNGFTFGAVGFPTVFGSYTDHSNSTPDIRVTRDLTHNKGYYVELFLDTTFAMTDYLGSGLPGTVSLFAKMNLFEAIGSGTLVERDSGGGVVSADMDSSFHRTMLVVGAKAEIDFDISGFTNYLPF